MDSIIQDHFDLFGTFTKRSHDQVKAAAVAISNVFLTDGRLFIIGSGTSSIISAYAHSIFVDDTSRPPFPAILARPDLVFHGDLSDAYERSLPANTADMIWGICADIKSAQTSALINTIRKTSAAGIKTLCLTSHGDSLRGVCDILISTESPSERAVHELHIFIIHAILKLVEERIFPGEKRSLE